MTTEAERLASLEAKADEASRQRDVIFVKLEDQDDALAAIRSDVTAIRNTLATYRGFWAGVTFVLTVLGGAIGAAFAALWHRVTGPSQ